MRKLLTRTNVFLPFAPSPSLGCWPDFETRFLSPGSLLTRSELQRTKSPIVRAVWGFWPSEGEVPGAKPGVCCEQMLGVPTRDVLVR